MFQEDIRYSLGIILGHIHDTPATITIHRLAYFSKGTGVNSDYYVIYVQDRHRAPKISFPSLQCSFVQIPIFKDTNVILKYFSTLLIRDFNFALPKFFTSPMNNFVLMYLNFGKSKNVF
jgi:hypothetical protein